MDVLSPHLRGIVIAGGLAVVALALGFMTLAMNQSGSSAAPHTVLSLKARHLRATKAAKPAAKHGQAQAAERAPRRCAEAWSPPLDRTRSRGSPRDGRRADVVYGSVAMLATRETEAGARLAGASFVRVSVDHDGGDASALTALIGKLPTAPATLVYVRPGTLYLQMPGFNDKTTVQQAAHTASRAPAGTTADTCAGSDAAGDRRRRRRRRRPSRRRVSDASGAPGGPAGREGAVRPARTEGGPLGCRAACDRLRPGVRRRDRGVPAERGHARCAPAPTPSPTRDKRSRS